LTSHAKRTLTFPTKNCQIETDNAPSPTNDPKAQKPR
jgi:hypothetical protein